GPTPQGEPVQTLVDPTVDISRAPEGVSGELWSARWTGTITPRSDGWHRFTVLPSGIVKLYIDGALIAAGQREFGQEFGGPALPAMAGPGGRSRPALSSSAPVPWGSRGASLRRRRAARTPPADAPGSSSAGPDHPRRAICGSAPRRA